MKQLFVWILEKMQQRTIVPQRGETNKVAIQSPQLSAWRHRADQAERGRVQSLGMTQSP